MDANSRISLIMLPYAGASFYAYRDFQQYLPYPVEPRAVDLPGHGKRMREALLTDIREMARDLFYQIQDELDGPYAIYGHSLGATLGYLLTRLIVDQKTCRHPLHLFLSGRSGPALEEKKPRHTLPRDEFIAAVRDYGGMPPELLEHEGLLDLFLPILRADFQAAETYAHEPCAPLDIPMTVMLGTEDRTSRGKEIRWRGMTTRECAVRLFAGGHFFFFDHLAEVCRMMVEGLDSGNSRDRDRLHAF